MNEHSEDAVRSVENMARHVRMDVLWPSRYGKCEQCINARNILYIELCTL
jgi:hypothetical protein